MPHTPVSKDPLDSHDAFFRSLGRHRHPLPIALSGVPFALHPVRTAENLTIRDACPARADPLILLTLFPASLTGVAVYFVMSAPTVSGAVWVLVALTSTMLTALLAYRIRTAFNEFSFSFTDRACTLTRQRVTSLRRRVPAEEVYIIVRPCSIKDRIRPLASFTGNMVFVASGSAVVVCAVVESAAAAEQYAVGLQASTGISMARESVIVEGKGDLS